MSYDLIATEFLVRADILAPGLVEGLYLQGSVALGDYHPGVSDIDFVAVTQDPADPALVREIHHGMPRRPHFDGLYVTWEDLRADPSTVPPGPAVHENRILPSSRFERHLVTWHVLAQAGVALRGPAKPEIFTDWPALAASTRENLESYWRPWSQSIRRHPGSLTSWAVSWGVLGVTRLRHSLVLGRVTSKTEAGRYALRSYPGWDRILEEALRLRCGGAPQYRNPFHRRTDFLGYLDYALHPTAPPDTPLLH
ncbi:nucleotidyltransferase domain-containing protein [Actinoplanes sp. GCM10030250]|uniref:nucleotidyltransferase domain-containing protein n=1 Tax=Actinoplanes sp. GCM10030250 TaxID=3273376 RepID=UPI003615A219